MSSVTLFSTLAVKKALDDVILEAFTTETGITVYGTFEPTNVLLDHIEAGSRPEVMIGVTHQLAPLGPAGVIDLHTCLPIARVKIGIATNPTLDAPDISTVPALIETLTNARSVAYSRTGASGVYFARLLKELGIAEQVNAKATIFQKGFTALAVIDGRADLAVQQMSELLFVPEAKLVAALPEDAQHYTEFSAAIGASFVSKAEPAALVRFLTSPLASKAYTAAGLELPGAPEARSSPLSATPPPVCKPR